MNPAFTPKLNPQAALAISYWGAFYFRICMDIDSDGWSRIKTQRTDLLDCSSLKASQAQVQSMHSPEGLYNARCPGICKVNIAEDKGHSKGSLGNILGRERPQRTELPSSILVIGQWGGGLIR